jgi:hypothetical protein
MSSPTERISSTIALAHEALDAHGSDELKKIYLEKLVSGEWTGTMQLTEPQAGSDVELWFNRVVRPCSGIRLRPHHAVQIEPVLRSKSPENGNIPGVRRRLSAISL